MIQVNAAFAFESIMTDGDLYLRSDLSGDVNETYLLFSGFARLS